MQQPATLSVERQTKAEKFWEGLEEGRIYATRCKKCGRTAFPPRPDCSGCLAQEPEWIGVDREAKLLTFSQVHVVPESFASFAPYILAVAETKDGYKLEGWVTGIPLERVTVGMRVQIKAGRLVDGRLGYELVPL